MMLFPWLLLVDATVKEGVNFLLEELVTGFLVGHVKLASGED